MNKTIKRDIKTTTIFEIISCTNHILWMKWKQSHISVRVVWEQRDLHPLRTKWSQSEARDHNDLAKKIIPMGPHKQLVWLQKQTMSHIKTPDSIFYSALECLNTTKSISNIWKSFSCLLDEPLFVSSTKILERLYMVFKHSRKIKLGLSYKKCLIM